MGQDSTLAARELVHVAVAALTASAATGFTSVSAPLATLAGTSLGRWLNHVITNWVSSDNSRSSFLQRTENELPLLSQKFNISEQEAERIYFVVRNAILKSGLSTESFAELSFDPKKKRRKSS